MEESRKKERGALLYAVLGVAVLIAAVAGSTFAYFQASTDATTKIEGETLDVKLGITLSKVSGTGDKGAGLIPIHDGTNATSQLQNAATANCIDKNKYTVCQIYEITLTNAGDTATVNTTVSFDKTSTNLKWAPMTSKTQMGTGTFAAVSEPGTIASDVSLGSTAVKQYIMIYVNNTGTNQSSVDGGKDFSGKVTVTASTGASVQAEF